MARKDCGLETPTGALQQKSQGTGERLCTITSLICKARGYNIVREALTPEQKLMNRKELTELGEALAKAERRKKVLEKR